jgi:ADP-heptose:LPS heptosyltransferase
MPFAYPEKTARNALLLEKAVSLTLLPLVRLLGRRQPREALSARRDRPVRVLIIEPFQIGDALSTSVLFAPLREAFPGCEITVLTLPKAKGIFDFDQRVHRHVTCPFPWANYIGKFGTPKDWVAIFKVMAGLWKENFDLGIDPRGEVRNQILLLLAGCRERIGYTNYLASNIVIEGKLLTHSAGNFPVIHRHRMNARILGSYLGNPALEPAYPSLGSDGLEPLQLTPGKRQVLIHPGGGWKRKRWPAERWAYVARGLVERPDVAVSVIGSPGEKEDVEKISALLKESGTPHETMITTMADLIRLIKGADLLIGLDSAPMNMTVCLGRPALAMFGTGDSAVWFPPGPYDRCLHPGAGIPGNPYYERNVVEEYYAADITQEEVLETALSILEKSG